MGFKRGDRVEVRNPHTGRSDGTGTVTGTDRNPDRVYVQADGIAVSADPDPADVRKI
jgi:hypothetical protein